MSDFFNTHTFRLYLDDDEEVAIDRYLSGFNKFRKAEITRRIIKLGFAQLQKEKGEGRTAKVRPTKPKVVKSPPPASPPPPVPPADEKKVVDKKLPDFQPTPVHSPASTPANGGAAHLTAEVPIIASTLVATASDNQMLQADAHLELGVVAVEQQHESRSVPDVTGSFTTVNIDSVRPSEPEQGVVSSENSKLEENIDAIEQKPKAREFIDPMARLRMGREKNSK